MEGKLAKAVITLEAEDVQRLKEVVMDEDRDAALAFVIEVIDQKVQCAQAETHKPAFEGDTGETAGHTWHRGKH